MTKFEAEYVKLIKKIMKEGEIKEGRNGVTKSLFGEMIDCGSVAKHFPILQGRKMFHKGVLGELSAMLNGATSVAEFEEHGCPYWKTWADEDGHLELDYGTSWLDFNGVNQLDTLRETLLNNPDDRRMLISGWRPDRLDQLSLPCCHYSYQFHTSKNEDGTRTLNMLWNQRSADTMVGVPSDAVFAAAWLIALANEVGMKAGNLKMVFGDTHIYEEHFDKVDDYLAQVRSAPVWTPYLALNAVVGTPIESLRRDDFELCSYYHGPAIKFELKA